MRQTLSVVISAYNEETKIGDALESVKNIADEIIVIDNSSTDKTASLAKKYTKKVFTQKNNPQDIDRQKNFGFEKATKQWTLSLDADERISPELVEEIGQVLSHDDNINAYWIPRRNIIFGKWIEYTGWYPDHQLRLFKTGKGKFVKQHVHEDVEVEGQKAYLHTDIIHLNFDSIKQFVSRNLLVYAKNEADKKLQDGYNFSYRDAIWFPIDEFLSRYFAREGYKDGLHGLMLSLLMAAYHLVMFAYIWEERGFPEEKINIKDLEKSGDKIIKDTKYWLLTSQINNEKNPLVKTVLKAKRKI